MVVKEEFDEEEEINHASRTESVEIKTELFSCMTCNATVSSENAVCNSCRQEQNPTFEEYPCVTEMLKSAPDHFMQYSGLLTVQSFIELLDYLEDDLPQIEGCHKSNQLLSVLIKLHFNNDWCYINKHRFPFVYVKTVNVLHEKLQFLGAKALESDVIPTFLRSLFRPDCVNVIVLDVITVKIDVQNQGRSRRFCKFLIAYTATGKVVFVSQPFSLITAFKTIVANSKVFKVLNTEGMWVVYKNEEGFVKCDIRNFPVSWTKLAQYAQYHFHEVCTRVISQFQILRDKFPEYCLLETDGMNFVAKTLSACCNLLNYKLYL